MPWDNVNNPIVLIASSVDTVLTPANDGDVLDPGSYQTSSGADSFAVDLAYEAGGVWSFNDLGAAAANPIAIGKATDKFFIKEGTELVAIDPQGVFLIDIAFANIEITGSTAVDEYVIEFVADATAVGGSLYQGTIPGGSYDFTVFPSPTTGNAYIDSAPADIPAGTHFIADGDITITTHPSANPFTVYEIKAGDMITVEEESANWTSAILNINAAKRDGSVCAPTVIATPASDWAITGGIIAGSTNFTIGNAQQQDGVAEYTYAVPAGNRSTKHVFSFDLNAVVAGGNHVALRVEVEQGGSVFASQDLLTTESLQSIELVFYPTADVIIRIRDTSTGTQGNNRDAVIANMQLVSTCEALPIVRTPGGLDTLSVKLHSVHVPSNGGLSDLTNQGRGLNPILGDVTFDADGNAVYGPGIRSSVNTDGEGDSLTLYAMIKYDDAADNDTNLSVFNGTNGTFIPLGGNSTSTETIRVDSVSNSHPFSVDGVSGFATRGDVRNAINTSDFVLLKVEGIANGEPIAIGDHPANQGFDYYGVVQSIVMVEGTPDATDDLIITHAMRNGVKPERLSRVTALTKCIAEITAPAMNNSGGGTGPPSFDADPIVITEPTALRFEHTGTVTGSSYFTFGTTAGQETDGIGSLSNNNIRISPASPSKTFESLVKPGTYFARLGAGGGSSVPSSSLKITRVQTGVIEDQGAVEINNLFEGVLVNAASPYTTSTPVTSGSQAEITTGVDFADVEFIDFHFTRTGGSPDTGWGRLPLKDFVYDDDEGGYVTIRNTTGIDVRINTAEIATGVLRLKTPNGTDYAITQIDFKKEATGVSNRVGAWEWAESGRLPESGFLPVVGGTTVSNGAIDYPVWASKHPKFIDGNDIVWPAWMNGITIRNLAGNAGLEDEFQDFATNVDGITATDSAVSNLNTNRGFGGGGRAYTQQSNSQKALQGGAIETRSTNFGAQLYAIVDTYLEPTSGGVSSESNPTPNVAFETGRNDAFGNKIYGLFVEAPMGVNVSQVAVSMPSAPIYLMQQPSGYATNGTNIYTIPASTDTYSIDLNGNDGHEDLTIDGMGLNQTLYGHTYTGDWTGYTMRVYFEFAA